MMSYVEKDFFDEQFEEFSNELFEEEVSNLIKHEGERYFPGSMIKPERYYSTIKGIDYITLRECDGYIYEVMVIIDNNMVTIPLPKKVLGIRVEQRTYYQ